MAAVRHLGFMKFQFFNGLRGSEAHSAKCLQHKAPQYMTDCCIHTSDIARRQHLWYEQLMRSAGCHQLFIPRHRRSMFGRRAFSVAGRAAWNS